jgi:hypothetical protein
MPKKTSKKPLRKKAAPKKSIKRPKAAKKPALKVSPGKREKPIGSVTHFYGDIKVAVIKFVKPPKIGAEVRFKGATTDFKQAIASAQYEHEPLKTIPKGKQVGVKVKSRVRIGDKVLPV